VEVPEVRRALVAVLAIAALALAAEIALRLLGAAYLELVRTPPASFSGRAKVKLLAIGDSFTFGIGADGADSYPDQLQAQLAERFGNDACETINWGLPAQNSSEALLALESGFARGLRPDFVLVAIGINNYWNWHLASPHLPGDSPVDRVRAAASGVRLWRLFAVAFSGGPTAAAKVYARNDESDRLDPWFADLRDTAPDWLTDWLEADLRAMLRLCREHDAAMVLVGYPLPSPTTKAAFARLTASTPGDLPTVDNEGFAQLEYPAPPNVAALLSPDGWHPNARGYQIVAENVAAVLEPAIRERLSVAGP
jgi:lysophospholipase L1-like esterase